MILDTKTAKKTAELLLQINAIKLNPQTPFTWASGWKSPIYCDNRILLSFPEARTYVSKTLADQLIKLYGKPDVIAGVATGAIGIGMLVANHLDLPFVYVRPEAKSHGRKNQIEGQLQKNQKVVVIEDLISTGNSSLNAVKALQEAQVQVLGMLAIFSYGFDISEENFKKDQVDLHILSNYSNLIQLAQEINYINANEVETLKEWRENPQIWKNKKL